jgi:hypothetical protein
MVCGQHRSAPAAGPSESAAMPSRKTPICIQQVGTASATGGCEGPQPHAAQVTDQCMGSSRAGSRRCSRADRYRGDMPPNLRSSHATIKTKLRHSERGAFDRFLQRCPGTRTRSVASTSSMEGKSFAGSEGQGEAERPACTVIFSAKDKASRARLGATGQALHYKSAAKFTSATRRSSRATTARSGAVRPETA